VAQHRKAQGERFHFVETVGNILDELFYIRLSEKKNRRRIKEKAGSVTKTDHLPPLLHDGIFSTRMAQALYSGVLATGSRAALVRRLVRTSR